MPWLEGTAFTFAGHHALEGWGGDGGSEEEANASGIMMEDGGVG